MKLIALFISLQGKFRVLQLWGLLLIFVATPGYGQARLDFITGKAIFEKIWVSSPASTSSSDGLGPYYNARSCVQCHPAAGRGNVENSLVQFIDDPVFGKQIQKFAVPGLPAEAASDLAVSARIAPALAGIGLLAQIPIEQILAQADPDDMDHDGISGRIHWLQSGDESVPVAGRFGWKATGVDLETQAATALSLDLGIGNPIFPQPWGDCTTQQLECRAMPHGDSLTTEDPELSRQLLNLLTFYLTNIIPPELPLAATASAEQLFVSTGCADCHTPEFTVADKPIRPYTDLLLHDMGSGLADNLVQGNASGAEWRTAPLCGLSKAESYMHDGRAQSLEEAILWHGGEAEAVVQQYKSLPNHSRQELLRFLDGL